MAWTATISGTARKADTIDVTVDFTNGADVVTKTLNFSGSISKDQVWNTIRRFVAGFESQDAVSVDLGTTDPGTPAQSPLAEFMSKYAKLVAAKRAVDVGAVAPDNADYLALEDEVKKAFRPEFLPFM